MFNKLVDAFDKGNRKKNKAERIEARYENKKGKIASKLRFAKDEGEMKDIVSKVGEKRDKTYKKIKKIQSSGTELGDKAGKFVSFYEKQQKMKKDNPKFGEGTLGLM